MPSFPSLVRRPAVIALAATFLSSGCSRHSDEDAARSAGVGAQIRSASAPQDSLRRGDIRIVTVDSGVDLALLGDSITAGLSSYTLEKVRRETDTSQVQGNDFGASISKFVKSTVANAIGTRVVFPLSSVRDVRYEGGALKFEWTGQPIRVFGTTKTNGRPVLQSFRPDDAQRFVDAVRSRKAGHAAAQ